MSISTQSSAVIEEMSADSEADDTSSFLSPGCQRSATNSSSSTSTSCSTSSLDKNVNGLKTLMSNLPSFNSKDWYSNKCFDRYWKHHAYVMSWYAKHRNVCKSLQKKYASSKPYQPYHYNVWNSYPSNNNHQESRQVVSKSVGRRNDRKCGRSAQTKRKQSEMQMEVETGLGASESGNIHEEPCESEVPILVPIQDSYQADIDISEEMLDFFAKSQKHRKEREAEKKAEMLKDKEEKLINIEDVKGQQRERTSEAPKERPGSRRTAEMKCLYGKGAAMIHGMETALQMTYDRNFDVKQPTYWPNMPFKIHFASV